MQPLHDQGSWSPADLFFLRHALKRGMEPEAVAGFLGRTESEVIAKAKALRILVTEQRARVRTDLGGSLAEAQRR